MATLAQLFRAFLVASAFFFFWAGAVLLSWTLCPVLTLVYADETARWRACQRWLKPAFRLFHGYMRVLALLEVRLESEAGPDAAVDPEEASAVGPSAESVTGNGSCSRSLAAGAPKDNEPQERPPGPLVIVCNHPTLVDVTAILATYDGVCCVVKAGLIDSVFVGRLLRTCGHVRGGSEAMAGAVLVQEARKRLEAGMAVLVFPEGTRSPPGGLYPFQRGAFELAKRARVPLWHLLLTCDPPALSKGLPFWRQPSRVAHLRIRPGPLLDVTDAHELRRSVEASFRQRLGCIPTAPGSALPAPPGRPAGSLASEPLQSRSSATMVSPPRSAPSAEGVNL